MKFVLPALAALSLFIGMSVVAAEPSLTADEKAQGFESLFNGKDFSGWEQTGNWAIDGDAISRAGTGGSLIYKAKKIPDDFELRFDWKVGKGSNSGVYYRPGQYEYQILDNANHGDGKNPRTSAASLYFCMAPSKDVTKPVGEWNEGRIVCKGTVVQHWLNGVKVIDLDYADSKYAAEVELLRVRGAKLDARGAYLSLQDHGNPVWYRNIRLRELKADDVLDRTPVEPAAIPADMLKKEAAFLENAKKTQAK